MGRVCWRADAEGAYWIDLLVGGVPVTCKLDTGFTDSQDRLGIELNDSLYDQLLMSGYLGPFQTRFRRDSGGNLVKVYTGETGAQLLDPQTRNPVGPQVRLYASQLKVAVPNLVGTVFFHRLTGCRVDWLLGAREWCVEYP